MKVEHFEYWFKGAVTLVRDGDTIEITRDKGFKEYVEDFAIRLKDVWCPETRGQEKEKGLYVKYKLEEKILGRTVACHSYKFKEKSFDRYVADVFYDGINLAEWLISQGYGTRNKEDLPALKRNFTYHLNDQKWIQLKKELMI